MFGKWKEIEDRRAEFQQELSNLVCDAGRLVVLVDELDRCSPERALRLLDVVRHLFDIPGVVVVLGVNELELRHRVTKIYGEGCNAELYLRRFLDLAIDLPGPGANLANFLNRAFAAVGLAGQMQAGPSNQYSGSMIEFLTKRLDMSARDILQLTHRIARVLALIPAPESSLSSHWPLQHTVLSMCVLRAAVPTTYRLFASEAIDGFAAVADLMDALALDKLLSADNPFVELTVTSLLALSIDTWGEVGSEEFERRFAAVDIDDTEAVERIRRLFNQLDFQYRHFELSHIVDLIELAV